MSRRRAAQRAREVLTVITFVGPLLVATAVLRLAPFGRAIYDSLHSSPLGFSAPHWVGLEQYRRLFDDPVFTNALKVTVIFGIVVNPLQIIIALGLATLFNERIRGAGLMRTLVFLPVAVPQSVSAVIWSVAFRSDGPLNGILKDLGLPGQRYTTSSTEALPSIMLVVSWIGVGYWMMFLVAGLKEIDSSLYEAAAIDGASRWQSWLHITIPSLRQQLLFVLVADTISNLLVFAPVQILTGGGPDGRTDLILNDIFLRAYTTNDTGSAAAETVVLVAVALVIVAIQFSLLSRRSD